LVDILQDFQERFVQLKTKWTQTFLEVGSSHAFVVKDLKMICDHLQKLKIKLYDMLETATARDAQTSTQLSHFTSELHRLETSCTHSVSQVQLMQHEQASFASAFQMNQ
jgi:hypothetical protein